VTSGVARSRAGGIGFRHSSQVPCSPPRNRSSACASLFASSMSGAAELVSGASACSSKAPGNSSNSPLQPLDPLGHRLLPCRACLVAESFWRPSGLTLAAPPGHRLLDFGPMTAVPSGKAWECGAQG
jgi:hypothetical protein